MLQTQAYDGCLAFEDSPREHETLFCKNIRMLSIYHPRNLVLEHGNRFYEYQCCTHDEMFRWLKDAQGENQHAQ